MRPIFLFCLLFVTGFFISCRGKSMHSSNENNKTQIHNEQKPGSSFRDSLFVLYPAAVFFEPDSSQLAAIKQVTDSGIFQSTMHEYHYQIQNARQYLLHQWKEIRIVNAVDVRYLVFRKVNGGVSIMDLDKQDPCGLYVFDRKQNPLLIDMTNIDTQVSDYFSNPFSGDQQ
jgi:hypothetical protein